MAIASFPDQAVQRLPEYTVGKASQECVYPGIQQCLAIAGWTPTGIICTHLSPGATGSDLATTFDTLRALGGASAQSWYVVGPLTDHFATPRAKWRSVDAIAKTFRKSCGSKTAPRWMLDITAERSIHSWGVDVQAEPCRWTPTVFFALRKAGSSQPWSDLKLHRFVRF